VSTPIKRKLATILSADVAGYSRLMGEDEEATLRLLAAHTAQAEGAARPCSLELSREPTATRRGS